MVTYHKHHHFLTFCYPELKCFGAFSADGNSVYVYADVNDANCEIAS